MNTPIQSALCPIVLGRSAQLAALNAQIEQAGAGQGRVLLLSGDAGVGKSRLAAEAQALAHAQGFELLTGRCFEADRARPYAPLIDMLQAFLASHTAAEAAEALGPLAADLLPLLPELRAIAPPAPSSDPPAQLAPALAQFVAGLAARGPVLALIEDLHWSDDASLDALLAVSRRASHRPIVLLLTYRRDEVPPGLARLLAELDRQRAATELVLQPLTRDEIDAMLRAIFGLAGPVRAEFLDAIAGLTEGNPFFIEEVLKSLIAAGEIVYAGGAWDRRPLAALHIPRSVQAAVQRRLDQLSPQARELIALAAVAGRRFEFGLLARLTEYGEAELVRLVKELVRAQLVAEQSPECFAFRHALTRQAVEADMLARERRALHARIAVALEQLAAQGGGQRAAELAQHAYAAEDWPRVRAYAGQAGQQALRLYAPQAAAEHYSHALAAAQRLGQPAPAELLRSRAQARALLGEFDPARADFEQAAERARAEGDPGLAWQSLLDLGFLWMARDFVRAGDCFGQALAAARADGDPARLAHSLNRLGNWHANADQPLRGQPYHQEALALFERASDARGCAETLDLLAGATLLDGDLAGGMALYAQAAAQFRALDDRIGLASSLSWLALCGPSPFNTMITPTALPASIAYADEALELARAIGWRSGEAFALVVRGMCQGAQGDYPRALPSLRDGLAIAQDTSHLGWLTAAHFGLGQLYLGLLIPQAAAEQLERALECARQSNAPFSIRLQGAALAQAYAERGELARAEALLDATFGPAGAGQARPTLAERLGWRARAELALLREQPTAALAIADQLLATAGSAADQPAAPALLLLRGRALAALRADAAEPALLAAREAARRCDAQPLLWQAHAALGRLYHARLRRRDAAQSYAAARQLAEQLAASIPEPALAEAFLRQAGARLPRPGAPTARQASQRELAGLTEREREVAALVAQGKSNREIAQALVLTERTTKAHVGSILAKLGFSSRTQIVAWAIDKRLV